MKIHGTKREDRRKRRKMFVPVVSGGSPVEWGGISDTTNHKQVKMSVRRR